MSEKNLPRRAAEVLELIEALPERDRRGLVAFAVLAATDTGVWTLTREQKQREQIELLAWLEEIGAPQDAAHARAWWLATQKEEEERPKVTRERETDPLEEHLARV